ncbi:hypothetical protein R1flu_001929 [Riccia fluitans]|uniref:Uncharacterized protein n=1 Tax=Riccia fluitans TaxID=41844 RepID=A0ABD1Y8L3_9MARC
MEERYASDEEEVKEKWAAIRTRVLNRMVMASVNSKFLDKSKQCSRVEVVSGFQQQTILSATKSTEYPVYAGPRACGDTPTLGYNHLLDSNGRILGSRRHLLRNYSVE